MFHYTDKEGWNALRSQVDWRFKVSQPKDPDRPVGVYFTDLEPSEINLRVLYKKIRVPREKQEYIFWFEGNESLTQLHGGTGRDKHIFYSSLDYFVLKHRQKYSGPTDDLIKDFP